MPGTSGQVRSTSEAPGRARPSRARFGGPTAGGPPMRAVRRFGYPGGHGSPSPPAVAARDLGSRPPIVAEVGGLEPSVPLVACAPRAASGGRKPWAVRPRSHIVRSARPRGERYPRAKPEDDAVGAPRLVLRRWGTTVVPRRVPPAPMQSKCPKGRGCVPRADLPNGGSGRSGR